MDFVQLLLNIAELGVLVYLAVLLTNDLRKK